jgi:putative flavoprotein involved in K+ transport
MQRIRSARRQAWRQTDGRPAAISRRDGQVPPVPWRHTAPTVVGVPADRIDTLVIGAGQAGLGVSHELAARGVEHLVLEQGRVGETWRSQRWDAFALNSAAWMNRLPGEAAPVRPDEFPSAPEFVVGLERYALRHRLPVREGVVVRRLDRGSTDDWLAVASSDGVLEARSVVVASGGARVRRVPGTASALSRSIHQLHTAEYRSAVELPAGAVLVVGGGQSGVQIAEDLVHAGRHVLLATSPVGRLPRWYRGRDSFAWLVDDGFFDEPRAEATAAPNPQISGVAGGHTLSYQHLERLGAVLLGGVAGMSGSRVRLRDDVAYNVLHADAVSAALRSRIDVHIARSGADAPAPDSDPADEPYPTRSLPQAPGELDLRRAGVTTVIWATGFDPDTEFVRTPVVGERGEISQRDGATAVPGLFAIGQPWLRSRRSATIYGVVADAPHVADLVTRRLAGRRRVAA